VKNPDSLFKTNTKYSPVLEDKEFESYKDTKKEDNSYKPVELLSNAQRRNLIGESSIDVDDNEINIE